MPQGKSSITRLVSFRLLNDEFAVAQRRVAKHPERWRSVGDYCRKRMKYDLTRSHKRKSREGD